MHKLCDNPLCQIGGTTKSATKRGSADLAHAYTDALRTSVRRVEQGHPPIGIVYRCSRGTWHHGTKPIMSRVVTTIDGIAIGYDRDVTRAECLDAIRVFVTNRNG